MPPRQSQSNAPTREVNNILHTLRGEDYRHAQNLKRSTARPLDLRSYNNPTLPFDQIYSEKASGVNTARPTPEPRTPVRLGPEGVLEYAYPRGAVPGPPPPKSWSGLFAHAKDKQKGVATRAEALSLILSHLAPIGNASRGDGSDARPSSVPPLTLFCLRYLLSLYSEPDSTDAFAEELVPCLPSHLRRVLLRWSAVDAPLPNPKLYALCEPHGHIEGELIVVGPQASLSREIFRRVTVDAKASASIDEGIGEEVDWSWDSPSSNPYSPPPLHTLILLNMLLPVTALLNLPPTLTHLALLALPSATPVHRLPRICPLIQVLDLSFNPWLEDPAEEGILNRVDWGRWSRLRVLGLRDCGVTTSVVARVNKCRWVDVDVIGVEVRTVMLEMAMSSLSLDGYEVVRWAF